MNRFQTLVLPQLFVLTACSPSSERLSEQQNVDWLNYGNTHSEQRFGTLEQINSSNVRRLGLAWAQEIPEARTLQATPLAVNGILYYSTDWGLNIYAVDGQTGNVVWQHREQSETPDTMRITMGAHRGLAYESGKVFAGITDGRLLALDAQTGDLVWSARTFRKGASRAITGAPRTFNGKVIIGHGGGDLATRGYVSTYDTETGELLWRFYTVPGNPEDGFEDAAMEMAAETWTGQWWKYGGGGTVWNGITYDPEFNRIYLGTGNSNPYSPTIRSPDGGDNLFLCSVVALDADTGEYIWHYQSNPREAWDYKATADMVLADLEIEGQTRKVLMQAPTNGFFYVIDRETGKLISAQKWGGKVNWAERIDLETGRPVEVPGIRYEDGQNVHMWPSTFGAHNYQSMSYNPNTGLVYIPHQEAGMIMGTVSPEQYENDPIRTGYKHVAQTGATFGGLLLDSENGGKGSLVAYDPIAQKERWRYVADSFWNGGTLTTAGNLTFYATALGEFFAFDATTGQKLWEFDVGLGVISAPMTFSVDGTQYISLLVGYGGTAASGIPLFKHGWKFGLQPRRLLTFKLDGTLPLPETPPPDHEVRPFVVEGFEPEGARVQRGMMLYHTTCVACHGGMLAAESVAPDLRESALSGELQALRAVLQQGLFAQRGMPLYDDLSDEDVEDIYHFIRYGAMTAGGEPLEMSMEDCTFCGLSN